MFSIERDEAQRAVLEVSIGQKANDACVDKLRDEDKLAKLVIFFTNGLQTDSLNHELHQRCKQKVQDNCSKGDSVLSYVFY